MMKTAFAYWKDRIAPVFDTARQIHVVEVDSGRIIAEREEFLVDDLPVQKALRLVEWGVGTLVCGAISNPMHELIAAYGIRVFSFIAGDLREVIHAWLHGNLERDVFAMPGCCRPAHRRFRAMHNYYQEVNSMNTKRCGKGAGGGKGQGQGNRRLAGMGGSSVTPTTGSCVCPQCGHQEPHERGMPCAQKQCPKCGAIMTRQ